MKKSENKKNVKTEGVVSNPEIENLGNPKVSEQDEVFYDETVNPNKENYDADAKSLRKKEKYKK